MNTNRLKRVIVVSLLACIFVCTLSSGIYGQDSFVLNSKRIDAFLSGLENQNFNGAVLVSNGSEVFRKGYGFADKENGIKAKSDTVFDIGSITKQFTGAAILKLEMMGKLSVEDRIGKHFRNVPQDKKEITIHHLLTHSAGFPGGIGNDYEVVGREEYVKRAFATKLNYPVGSRYDYSNVGFSLLAAIIEKTSGMTYEEFLTKHLFKPSGMMETGYLMPKWEKSRVAVGYRGERRWGKPNEKPWGENSPSWHLVGNGGILSTVDDMHKWHLALLGTKVLSEEAKAKYFKRHIKEGEGARSYYGYGWAIFPTSRKTWLIAHNGGNGIFFADFWRFTDEKVTIIMLTNSVRREFERIPGEIAKSVFQKDYRPSIEIVPTKKIASLDEHPNGKLIKAFLKSVGSKNIEEIEKFAEGNFTQGFLKIAPIRKHQEILSGLAAELEGAPITAISIQGNRTTIEFGNGKVSLRMRISDGKIAGIGF